MALKTFIALLLSLLICSCSSDSNLWTSKFYHNTTAHFNGYYYAREEIRDIEKTIWENRKDDYNNTLKVFIPLDSTLAKSYDDKIQEAIKMASLAIQRHPRSKWADDAYLLVGKARMYSLDWGNAITTLKYVNQSSKDDNTRHLAIIWLIRTFTEKKEYDNALAAMDYLDKQKLSRTNAKNLFLEKAHYYEIRNDDDHLVRNLIAVDTLLTSKDRPGRIYFIIGQLYQKLGFEAQSYQYYSRCLATNPEYEVDFYARLYQAQVTEISANKDINSARKSFKKLLKDPKNKQFKDKIYYEMGTFELKAGNTSEAIGKLNLAIRTGTNTSINGEAYLSLGQIYYDQRDYEQSKKYYDSAITALPTDFRDYASIKSRQETLKDLAENIKTIQWQDSLLSLSEADSATIIAEVQKYIDKNTPPVTRKKRKATRVKIENENNAFAEVQFSGVSDWYFGNPSAIAAGELDFQKVWGKIALADNWRRSSKTGTSIQSDPVIATETTNQSNIAENKSGDNKADPVTTAYKNLWSQIPRTDAQKEKSLEMIETAYFKLGDIYHYSFKEDENAIASFEKLLQRFPKTKYEPETLYKLYLLYKEKNDPLAQTYSQRLVEKYPSSSFTKVLLNPDYLKQSTLAAEEQKKLYAEAYQQFNDENYAASKNTIDQALQLGETYFVPQLKLLSILIIGKTENATLYQYSLEQFVKENPEEKLSAYAGELLKASRKVQLDMEKTSGIQFISSFQEPHYFVALYQTNSKISDVLTTLINQFNKTRYPAKNINTSNLTFNDTYTLTLASEFSNSSEAIQYWKDLNSYLSTRNEVKTLKIDKFVITKDNFTILYRTKGLNEYLRFFEKNYPGKNP